MGITNNESRLKRKELTDPLLEIINGEVCGKNPDNVTEKEFLDAGHRELPLGKVIRKKCLDCCGFQHAEVRKCIITSCGNWPYRMGKSPFLSMKYKKAHAARNGGEA